MSWLPSLPDPASIVRIFKHTRKGPPMNTSNSSPVAQSISPERVVRERYSQAAQQREEALCCPVSYDPRYLAVIPQEVLDRDYGCGDPSAYVQPGDTVLDLGSGGGKLCFIAAQIAGPQGRVIGVDINPEMLAMARSAAGQVADALGYANVEFRSGRIQDLALDLELLDGYLAANPLKSAAEFGALEDTCERLRRVNPLIAGDSVDLVVSNCVLNLVPEHEKPQLIREVFRVLRRGGRIAISDIVCDEPVPGHLRNDAELWSGCVSGALEERRFLAELEAAGFYGITIDKWESEPFRVVEGIEFRSVTITAHKGKEGPCYEAGQAVIYKGPWSRVEDDDGHVLLRGERTAVCAKTYDIYCSAPYRDHVIAVSPHEQVPVAERELFDCSRDRRRDPRESKGAAYELATGGSAAATGSAACCSAAGGSAASGSSAAADSASCCSPGAGSAASEPCATADSSSRCVPAGSSESCC